MSAVGPSGPPVWLVCRCGLPSRSLSAPAAAGFYRPQAVLPALIRQAKGGPGPDKPELRAFHDALYQTYLTRFASQRNTVFHMKELWSYLVQRFAGGEKPLKKIRKAADSPSYEAAVEQMFALPLKDWESPSPHGES